jgi:ribonuclease E
MAGNFDIERIGQRDPESRPKPVVSVESAAIEAELEAEPEPVEEEEPESEQEAPREDVRSDSQPQQPLGENGGRRKRRRRRRGGRDRERPFQNDQRPEQSPQPQQFVPNGAVEASPAVEQAAGGEPGEVAQVPQTVQQPQFGQGPQGDQQGPAGEGGPRRKRRRRRGRRGGRDRENFNGEQRADGGAPSFGHAPLEQRFGQPDEIDTTPREEPRVALPEPPKVPYAAPNAASTPVWSLKADTSEPSVPKSKPNEERPRESVSTDSTPAQSTPAQPTKKGWWQRAFKSD